MIKVFYISKSYHFTSMPCIFQTNFKIPLYIGICKEKVVTRDFDISLFNCFYFKVIFSLNECDLNFMIDQQ